MRRLWPVVSRNWGSGGLELVITIDMAKNETMEFNSKPETAMEFKLRNFETTSPDKPKTIPIYTNHHNQEDIFPHMETFPIQCNITQS